MQMKYKFKTEFYFAHAVRQMAIIIHSLGNSVNAELPGLLTDCFFRFFREVLFLLLPIWISNESYGILFISLGYLEHDGYLVLAGYVTVIATAIYYILIFAIGIKIILIIISYFGLHP